jgi:hypothetical protein
VLSRTACPRFGGAERHPDARALTFVQNPLGLVCSPILRQALDTALSLTPSNRAIRAVGVVLTSAASWSRVGHLAFSRAPDRHLLEQYLRGKMTACPHAQRLPARFIRFLGRAPTATSDGSTPAGM